MPERMPVAEPGNEAGLAGPSLMASGLGLRLAGALLGSALVWLVILGSLR